MAKGTTLYGAAIAVWFFTLKPTTGPGWPVGPFFNLKSCQAVQQFETWLREMDNIAIISEPCHGENESVNTGMLPITQGLKEVPRSEWADPYHLKNKGVKK